MTAQTTAGTVPVHVLTGFLGSGKSTLLNRLLASTALANSAVIVNEFGDIGIDHLLVEHSEDNLVELVGGCVCCAIRGDLALTLVDLMSRRERGTCARFERIIVETTGVADPAPIHNLLVTDPGLAALVHHAGVLTTVDAINGPSTLDSFPDAVKQVALADRIVLTKTDLAEKSPAPTAARLARINPGAEITVASHGNLPGLDQLWNVSTSARLAPAAAESVHRHADGIDTFTLWRDRPIPGAALALFIEALAEQAGARLLRLKGLVAIEESPQRPALVQGAQHVFHPLEFLARWPDDDHRTRLVFIGQGVQPRWVERLLDALVWETQDIGRRLARD